MLTADDPREVKVCNSIGISTSQFSSTACVEVRTPDPELKNWNGIGRSICVHTGDAVRYFVTDGDSSIEFEPCISLC